MGKCIFAQTNVSYITVTHIRMYVMRRPNIFADKIRVLRQEKKLTQAEVAKEVGLSARGYQDLELGAKPGFDNLLHIADFYDVSVDWLMGRTDNPHAHR